VQQRACAQGIAREARGGGVPPMRMASIIAALMSVTALACALPADSAAATASAAAMAARLFKIVMVFPVPVSADTGTTTAKLAVPKLATQRMRPLPVDTDAPRIIIFNDCLSRLLNIIKIFHE